MSTSLILKSFFFITNLLFIFRLNLSERTIQRRESQKDCSTPDMVQSFKISKANFYSIHPSICQMAFPAGNQVQVW